MKKSHDAKSNFDAWIVCQELVELKLQRLANKRQSHMQAYKEKNLSQDNNKWTHSSALVELESKKKLEERESKNKKLASFDGKKDFWGRKMLVKKKISVKIFLP